MPNAIDYKKEYKDLYLPKTEPMIINEPEMCFVAVEGKGDPNDNNGEYQKALEILYSKCHCCPLKVFREFANGSKNR